MRASAVVKRLSREPHAPSSARTWQSAVSVDVAGDEMRGREGRCELCRYCLIVCPFECW